MTTAKRSITELESFIDKQVVQWLAHFDPSKVKLEFNTAKNDRFTIEVACIPKNFKKSIETGQKEQELWFSGYGLKELAVSSDDNTDDKFSFQRGAVVWLKGQNHFSLLYMRSGGGKTRSLFEFLCQYHGLFFLCGVDEGLPKEGSLDFDLALKHIKTHLKTKSIWTQDHFRETEYNEAWMSIVVYIRLVLCHKLLSQHKVSALQWLLIQLFPKTFLGDDVCYKILKEVIKEFDSGRGKFMWLAGSTSIIKMVRNVSKVTSRVFPVVFDEINVILQTGLGVYDDFRAVCKASLEGCHVLLSGTGFSLETVRKRLSDTAQPGIMRTEFNTLGPEACRQLLTRFVNFQTDELALLEGICHFIQGRPRWTVVLLQHLLRYPEKTLSQCFSNICQANYFRKEGRSVYSYVRRLVALSGLSLSMDAKQEIGLSKTPKGVGLPSLEDRLDMKRALITAVFNTVLGNPTLPEATTQHVLWFVEYGIANVPPKSSLTFKLQDPVPVDIQEPIVVANCLPFVKPAVYLKDMIQKVNNDSVHGFLFEFWLANEFPPLLVDYLRSNSTAFAALKTETSGPLKTSDLEFRCSRLRVAVQEMQYKDKEKFSERDGFGGEPRRMSCWLHNMIQFYKKQPTTSSLSSSTNAKKQKLSHANPFEQDALDLAQVPPAVFLPCIYCGPDLCFLLRDAVSGELTLVLVQAKFKGRYDVDKEKNQRVLVRSEAKGWLQTVNPAKLYEFKKTDDSNEKAQAPKLLANVKAEVQALIEKHNVRVLSVLVSLPGPIGKETEPYVSKETGQLTFVVNSHTAEAVLGMDHWNFFKKIKDIV